MSEENKQRLKEHQKTFREAKKISVKVFYYFFLTWYKIGTKSFDF